MKIKNKLESLQVFKKSKKKQKSKKSDLKKKKKGKDILDNKAEVKDDITAENVAPETKAEIPQTPLKTTLKTTPPSESSPAADVSTIRQRVSKNVMAPTQSEQTATINLIIKQLLLGEVSQGTALRELRVKALGLKQEAFIELVGVSRKTLSEIENDKGNYTSEITNKVFKPFGLKVGLVPISSNDLKSILDKT